MESAELVTELCVFLREIHTQQILENLSKGKNYFVINFQELAAFNPELAEELITDPENTLKGFQLAAKELDSDVRDDINVQIFNLPQTLHIPIRNIRDKDTSKLMCVTGIILDASDVRQRITSIRFECRSCSTCTTILQNERAVVQPNKCGCGSKKFRKLEEERIDVQKVALGEDIESLDSGEQPKRLNVLLEGELCSIEMAENFNGGNKIEITGIITSVPPYDKNEDTVERDVVLKALHTRTLTQEFETIQIDDEDVLAIQALSQDPLLTEKMVASIAPDIYGYEDVKQALILTLFGGVEVKGNGGKRGEIHILLAGDPGTAKTRLAKGVLPIAPKSRIAGTGSSGVGLTAAAVENAFLGGWRIEAGTLVLANRGTAVLDELEKLPAQDRNRLHEPMEEGIVVINKANIHAVLPSKTSIIATCNPKYSRFSTYEPFAKQIDIQSTLLNRFDLIELFIDTPEAVRDGRVARAVTDSRKNNGTKELPIPPELFKKYIAFAKQRYNPTYDDDIQFEFNRFYVEIRSTFDATGAIPINARQLDALIRLSQASARMRLSHTVELCDVGLAKKLLLGSLEQVAKDPNTGRLDMNQITESVSVSKLQRMPQLFSVIKKMWEDNKRSPIEVMSVIEKMCERSWSQEETEEALENLKKRGDIFNPRAGQIMVIP